ncbi:MAG: hypothetical protein ACK5JS_01085 [Mangrovibacterium sp.]
MKFTPNTKIFDFTSTQQNHLLFITLITSLLVILCIEHYTTGDFNNVDEARYAVPTHWNIGKIYKRLILRAAKAREAIMMDMLFEAYDSFVTEKIEDYNSSFYYESPQYILNNVSYF